MVHGTAVVWLPVDDVQRAHPWGRVATLEDPEGNDVQLYEPPQG